MLEHKSLSTSGIHRFGVDVEVRLKKIPIIKIIFYLFFHCLSHQVSHIDGEKAANKPGREKCLATSIDPEDCPAMCQVFIKMVLEM